MEFNEKQISHLKTALWDLLEKNFVLSSSAIDAGEWDLLEYRRKQREEIRELLDKFKK